METSSSDHCESSAVAAAAASACCLLSSAALSAAAMFLAFAFALRFALCSAVSGLGTLQSFGFAAMTALSTPHMLTPRNTWAGGKSERTTGGRERGGNRQRRAGTR